MDYRDIEAGAQEAERLPEPEAGKGGGFLLFQAAVCILALLALAGLKLADTNRYELVRDWYQSESARVIELPSWDGAAPAASPDPFPAPSEEPAATEPPAAQPPADELDGDDLRSL